MEMDYFTDTLENGRGEKEGNSGKEGKKTWPT